jgi:hypothetical protein
VFKSRHLKALILETGLIAKIRIKKFVESSRALHAIEHETNIASQTYATDIGLNGAKTWATISIGVGHLKHIGKCWITRAF